MKSNSDGGSCVLANGSEAALENIVGLEMSLLLRRARDRNNRYIL
jgi:hypothetical protein